MTGSPSLRRVFRAERGMTLIELLVVAALLAAVSFIAYSNFGGVVEDSKEQVARAEMLEIAEAIRQFKQDTGYYPKQGPFGLHGYDGGIALADLPAELASLSDPEKAAWFYSPANFWQLFDCPEITTPAPPEPQWPEWLGCDPLDPERTTQSWNASRGRGWRGPYLVRDAETSFALSAPLSRLSATGKVTGSGSDIDAVRGIADPFDDKTGEYGSFFAFDLADTTAGLHDSTNAAAPYDLRPRIVSMGADSRYGGRYDPDPCEPNSGTDDGEDDIVLCIE